MPFLKRVDKISRSRRIEKTSEKNGLRCGIFRMDGSKYIGDWKNNKQSGKGRLISRTNVLYEGDFKNDLPCGFGVEAEPFENDKVYTLCYRGHFRKGKRHNGGTYHRVDGSYYDGQWKGGKRHGYGLLWYADGVFYAGYFFKGYPQGLGMLVYLNGDRYEGEWRGGLKHGRGRYYHIGKGTMHEGIWVDDICVFGVIKIIPYRQSAMYPISIPYIHEVAVEDLEEILRDKEDRVLAQEASSCESLYATTQEDS